MVPALLALVATTLLTCAHADNINRDGILPRTVYSSAETTVIDPASLLSGCLYESQWYASGAPVSTRETCLRCVCMRSALSCRRRACASLPDPPPKRCHVRHRRGACCPELHCPDRITNMEHAASLRFDIEDNSEIATPSSLGQACVEGGSIYAAGSAMASNVACEQCFCLKGVRRCVRPTCMPPPPHCVSRPTAGACCPQRYYCEHESEHVRDQSFDCKVNGNLVREGERVLSNDNCTSCFCLKGTVRCQELSCAPPLHGCEPVLRPGDCCAHQYKCDHNSLRRVSYPNPMTYNTVASTRNDDRALHAQKWSKLTESTTKKILSGIYTVRHTPVASATKNDLITTIKVKRKTSEPPLNSSEKPLNDTELTTAGTTQKPITSAKLTATETTELTTERTTEQPEGTVKIVINGTINCTAELSSTSLPLSISFNDTDKIQMEAMPRVPIVNGIEAQTYSPNDIITDRSVNGDFDENDTFTINVTSSLNANTNTTARPAMTTVAKIPVPIELADSVNSSKKTKEDYDYDYTEPTLPPSLPNLKIIPFVAADAVVDDEPPKETLTYPILEREDKFPVYYPTDSKDTSFTRREDIYHPTQYPVFISEREPAYTPDIDLSSSRYPVQNDLVHEYTVSSLGNQMNEGKAVTKAPVESSTFELKTPAVNLFSPPVETEGGFIPKGPGISDEYFAVYPSTPSGPSVPHLTTSMQLDIGKGECKSTDGQHVPEGESTIIECSECVCTWGRLSCAPTVCQAPTGCEFKPLTADSVDQCCGDVVCGTGNKITPTTVAPETEREKVNENKEDMAVKNESKPLQVNKTLQQVTTILPNITDNKETNTKPIDNQTINPSTKSPIYSDNATKAPKTNLESTPSTTAAPTTTIKPITKLTTTTTSTPTTNEVNDTSSEYEDDEDEGFSFGSVLKLLLSDNYDSTTPTPYKKPSTSKPPTKPPIPAITSTRRPPSTVNPFIPLPSRPYNPPKMSPSTVNRIDHLVLGEATAIKRTTPRPITNKTTRRPTERPTERPDADLAFTSGPRPPNLVGLPGPGLSGVGAGLLKLAGCNIYGRMYRVGRIIAELSTPCQECWCTELGVQCKPLGC